MRARKLIRVRVMIDGPRRSPTVVLKAASDQTMYQGKAAKHSISPKKCLLLVLVLNENTPFNLFGWACLSGSVARW
jgi:hypothetical protein